MNYYYSIDGSEVAGPNSLEKIQALFDSGALFDTTQVCQEGQETWQPLLEVMLPNGNSARHWQSYFKDFWALLKRFWNIPRIRQFRWPVIITFVIYCIICRAHSPGQIVSALVRYLLLWPFPIYLGVKQLKRKGYSPYWMCLGIIPLVAWIIWFCSLMVWDARSVSPHTSVPLGSVKRILPAFILLLFLGGFGAHRFYIGRPVTALITPVLTISGFVGRGGFGVAGFVVAGLWLISDFIRIVIGSMTDGYDQPITQWT